MKRRNSTYSWRDEWMKTTLKDGKWWDQFNRVDDYKFIVIPPLPRSTTKAEWRQHASAYRHELTRQKWWDSDKAKAWFAESHICSHCSREVSNREWYGTRKDGSSHLRGICKPPTFFPQSIPQQSWKAKLTYPMPAMPDYSDSRYPTTMPGKTMYERLNK
jgi:hypothetical protein